MKAVVTVVKALAWRITRLFFSSWKGLVISIVSPLCLLFFLGPTLGVNVQTVDVLGHPVGYLAFFLPGVMTMALFYGTMFTAGNSVVVDRVTGYSETIRTSPNPGFVIVSGHVLGSVLIGGIQAILFLVIGLVYSPAFSFSWLSILAVAFVLLGALFFGVLGFVLGSRVSFSNFSLVFTIASIPLVYTSTIFVPAADFPAGLQPVVLLNPVSIMADLLRAALLGVSSWSAVPGGLVSAVAIDGSIFAGYFSVTTFFALYLYNKFPRFISRKRTRDAGKKNLVMDSPIFEMVANAIGKEKLQELLPLVQQGRVDELLKHFPRETVEKLLSVVKDALANNQSGSNN
ncbi:MAG: ABC transporter permease [Candidatus Sigynarchaeota archaeon]